MIRLGSRLALGLLIAGLAVPAAAQTVGANAAVVADVRMSTQAEPAMHQARVRERVSLGNRIESGRSGRLQILLLDGTSFQIGGNTQMTVTRFVYDPAQSASEVGVDVARGSFRLASGAPTRRRPGRSGVRTPAASIGVRGTIVEGVVGPDAVRIAESEPGIPPFTGAVPESASLFVLRGPAPGPNGEPGGAFDVTAGGSAVPVEQVGFAVFVPAPGAMPIGPFPLSGDGLSEIQILLDDPGRGVTPPNLDEFINDPLADGTFEGYEDDYYTNYPPSPAPD